MTDKYYDIYFDRGVLQVDQDGHLENPGALHIIEFEYDDETEEVTACRRVDQQGNVLEDRPDLSDLEHSGDGDDQTIGKALGRFEGWLNGRLIWVESSRATRWEPADYTCIGIDGCVPTAEDAKFDWWDNGGKEQTLYGL